MTTRKLLLSHNSTPCLPNLELEQMQIPENNSLNETEQLSQIPLK